MIGQENLTSRIHDLVSSNMFPGFTILVGPEGSGKKKLCKYIARALNYQCYMCGTSVEDIRQMIHTATTYTSPILYVIADADRMSPAAKNALLKVTEEPPRNTKFIMTLTDINNTLATIKSRASVMTMDIYKPAEIIEYANSYSKKPLDADSLSVITNVCATPGDVEKLIDTGIKAFNDYVQLVVDKIDYVSSSNSFKIGQRIAFKETDEDKFDPILFLRGFENTCLARMTDDLKKYSTGLLITSKYLQDMRLVGVNKQSTFDMWLLDIREAWMWLT